MIDSGVDAGQAAAPAPAANPLAAARMAAGLSIADVGRQLKLSGWQIEALEAADYARLPGPVFVRGFLRNYARLLKIDPAPLLADIPGLTPAVAPAVAAVAAPSTEIPFPGQRRFKWQPYALGGLLIVAVLAGYQFYGDDAAAPEADSRTVDLPAPKAITDVKPLEATPATTLESPPPPAAASAPAPAAAPAAKSNPAAPVPAPARSMAAPQGGETLQPARTPMDAHPPQAVKAPVDPLPVQTVKPAVDPRSAQIVKAATDARTPGGESGRDERIVRMVFSRDSWVEVRDRQGRTVFSQLNPAGTAQTISAQPPLRLVVGNATGVRVLYNDRPVDLAPHTQVDVARLTLE